MCTAILLHNSIIQYAVYGAWHILAEITLEARNMTMSTPRSDSEGLKHPKYGVLGLKTNHEHAFARARVYIYAPRERRRKKEIGDFDRRA